MNVVEIKGDASLMVELRTLPGFTLEKRTWQPDDDGLYRAWGQATDEALDTCRLKGAAVEILMDHAQFEEHRNRVFSQIGKDSTPEDRFDPDKMPLSTTEPDSRNTGDTPGASDGTEAEKS
jgi:hypothetical protein